ncbi:hypothetical protein [Roseicella sp. DB1501]|uniref:hypothetical protein n=1 Tax=Roseicella sp. DB1501 TaxID=2730925 RepID=UPI001490C5DE|nr:hypothetical protein [Roseicella sp. DB1501]NOG74057.1 hypothetical protein [Roseicella sp. DB1501]
MIVGYVFEGDSDKATKWEQHDVYGRALQIIAAGCREHVRLAVALLQTEWPARWVADGAFDHRTLQDAHDTLAAVWRHDVCPAQPELPFRVARPDAADRMSRWLSWLSAEMESWRHSPRGIVLVMTILSNQNTLVGYQAEDELAEWLRERFHTVPWRRPRIPLPPTAARMGVPVSASGGTDEADPDDFPRGLDGCDCVRVGRPPCHCLPCITLCEQAEREGWGPLE